MYIIVLAWIRSIRYVKVTQLFGLSLNIYFSFAGKSNTNAVIQILSGAPSDLNAVIIPNDTSRSYKGLIKVLCS